MAFGLGVLPAGAGAFFLTFAVPTFVDERVERVAFAIVADGGENG